MSELKDAQSLTEQLGGFPQVTGFAKGQDLRQEPGKSCNEGVHDYLYAYKSEYGTDVLFCRKCGKKKLV